MTSPGSAAAEGGGSLLMPGTWVAYTSSQTTSPGSVTSTVTSFCSGPLSSPPPDILVIDVSSAESTADGNDVPNGTASSPPVTPESSRRQWRRSSWCPEQDRKKEEKQEMQRSLAVVGKSLSMSSLEGDDDDDTDSDDAGGPPPRPAPESTLNDAEASPDSGSNKALRVLGIAAAYTPTPASVPRPNNGRRQSLSANVVQAANARTRPPRGPPLLPPTHHLLQQLQPVQQQQHHHQHHHQHHYHQQNQQQSSPSSSANGRETCLFLTPSAKYNSDTQTQSPTSTRKDKRKSRSKNDSTHEDSSPQPDVDDSSSTLGGSATSPTRKFCKSIISRAIVTDGVYNSTSTGDEDEDEQQRSGAKQQKVKRRSSVFSKLGGHKSKKGDRDGSGKLARNNHQFMLVSFSNSTVCDVCAKSMANKAALQCENCLLNVHEHLCKDQTNPCTKFRTTQTNNEEAPKEKNCKTPDKVPASLPVRTGNSPQSQHTPIVTSRSISPQSRPTLNTGYFQWRRVANKLGIDRVAADDKVKELENPVEDLRRYKANLSEVVRLSDVMSFSTSVESLNLELADFDDEPSIQHTEQEPEAWSVTVDLKTLKKMTAKNIKRQDHIWEFIQTEKRHYRTLKIMQRIFSQGMMRELNVSRDLVERLFSRLDDLVDLHLTFLHSLVGAQQRSVDKSIEEFGPILLHQFGGAMGDRMKTVYGAFCSRHSEALQLYKALLKSDATFQEFVKRCSHNSLCKRLGIPECILLVTQRVTKYPLLIEPIVKTTADGSADKRMLTESLSLSRDILNYINRQVDEHEKEQRLFDIYNKLDARSSTIVMGKKFKKSDMLSNKRKLLYEGRIKWMSARGKTFEVVAVILSDIVFFLAESGQKYTFFSQDNKSSVIPLSKLLVREKGDTRDGKGVYLIYQSKTEPEMYEFVCRSADERKLWIQTIRSAIASCTEEGITCVIDEEQTLQQAMGAHIKQLIDRLHQKDYAIRCLCDEKFNNALEILELFVKDDLTKISEKDLEMRRGAASDTNLHALLHEITRLFELIQLAPEHRSVDALKNVLSENTNEVVSTAEENDPSKAGSPQQSQNGNDLDATRWTGFDDTNRDPSSSTGDEGVSFEVPDSGPSPSVSADDRLQGIMALTRDQCSCLAKILQYIHRIVTKYMQQTTELECARGLVAEANFILVRYGLPKVDISIATSSDKKAAINVAYQPEKQLEELRNLQNTLHQQKSDLEKSIEKHETEISEQREELLRMQENLNRQKSELLAQQQELNSQRESLQYQFEQLQGDDQIRRRLTPTTPTKVFTQHHQHSYCSHFGGSNGGGASGSGITHLPNSPSNTSLASLTSTSTLGGSIAVGSPPTRRSAAARILPSLLDRIVHHVPQRSASIDRIMRRSTGSSASLSGVGELQQQQPYHHQQHHHRRSGNFGGEHPAPTDAMQCCSRSSSPGSPCGYGGIGSVPGPGFVGSGDLLSPCRLHQTDGRSVFWSDATLTARSLPTSGDGSSMRPMGVTTGRAPTSPSTPIGSPLSSSTYRQIVAVNPSSSSATRSPSESSPSEYDDASSVGKSSTNSGDNVLGGGTGVRTASCCAARQHHHHHQQQQQQQQQQQHRQHQPQQSQRQHQRRPEKFHRDWNASMSSTADAEDGDNFDGDEDDDYDDISPL